MNFGQASLPCDICDSTDDVFWNCVDCKANLCEKCYNEHLKGNPVRVFKNHNIVPVEEAFRSKYSDEPCKQHPVNAYILHCNNCLQLVCPSCIIGDHKGHSLCKIEDAMANIFQDITQYAERIEKSLLLQCDALGTMIMENIKQCEDWYTKHEGQIQEKREEFITEVHCHCDDLLQAVTREKNKNISAIDQNKDVVEAKHIELTIMLNVKNEVMKKGNSEIIQFSKDKPDIEGIITPTVSSNQFPKYIKDRIDGLQVAQTYISSNDQYVTPSNRTKENCHQGAVVATGKREGHTLKQVPVIEIRILSRQKYKDAVHTIDIDSSDDAWVSALNSKEIRKLNTKGEQLQKWDSKYKVNTLKVMANGDIITSHLGAQCLQILSGMTGRVVTDIDTDPYKPSGVCVTKDGQHIAVCLYKEDMTSTLQVYRKDGRLIRTFNYTDRKSSDYYIQRVTTNESGDYCVAHLGLDTVFVISSTGSLRFAYCGSTAAQYTDDFHPRDIVCDRYNHLLISDGKNNTIHMLNQSGQFLKYLLNYTQDGIEGPTGLSLDNEGKLWIGQNDGTLLVVKYWR